MQRHSKALNNEHVLAAIMSSRSRVRHAVDVRPSCLATSSGTRLQGTSCLELSAEDRVASFHEADVSR